VIPPPLTRRQVADARAAQVARTRAALDVLRRQQEIDRQRAVRERDTRVRRAAHVGRLLHLSRAEQVAERDRADAAHRARRVIDAWQREQDARLRGWRETRDKTTSPARYAGAGLRREETR